MDRTIDGITISSSFDSGNLAAVLSVRARARGFAGALPTLAGGAARPSCAAAAQTAPLEFSLWIRADCAETVYETSYRTWFYFSVTGVPSGATLSFRIVNMSKQHGLCVARVLACV